MEERRGEGGLKDPVCRMGLLCEINVRLSNRGFYVAPIIFYIILVFFFWFDTSIETCALSLAHALAMPDKNTALRID